MTACAKGHTEWRVEPNGRRRCVVCERARYQRYRAKNRDKLLQRQRALYAERKAAAMEQQRLAEFEKMMADVQAMRERVAKRKRQQQLRRLLAAS